MPPKPKPKPKKAEPPPTATDNRKRQASDAAEQPVKRPCWGTNQKNSKPEEEEEEEEDDEDEDEGDPAPWAEVEEKAISKGKVKGPARGRGNQGQAKQAPGKKPRYIFFFFPHLIYLTLAVEKLPRPATEKMQPCKAHQRLNKHCNFFLSFVWF